MKNTGDVVRLIAAARQVLEMINEHDELDLTEADEHDLVELDDALTCISARNDIDLVTSFFEVERSVAEFRAAVDGFVASSR